MPYGTITSTENTFGTVNGALSGTVAGTLSGSVGVPGPQGSQGQQGIQGPQGEPGPPGPGSTWGTITGTLSAQTDLQTALNGKYSTSNPDGFITSAALTGYLTKAGNLSGLADVNIARENINLGTNAEAEFYSVFMDNGTAHAQVDASNGLQVWDTSTSETVIVASSGITFPDLTVQTTAYPGPAGATTWGTIAGTLSNQTDLQTALNGKYSTSNPSGFITASALTPYLTSATAASTYQTLSGMSSYLTTSAAASTYQTLSGMSDYLSKAGNLSGLASTSTARTNLGLGTLAVVNDAPSDGSQYARKNGAWDVVSAGADYISSVSSPLSVTTGNLTIDLSAYAPLSSPLFTGDARAVTPTFGDNDTSIATTAFVQAALAGGTAVAKNLEVYVRNQTGSSVPAGSIVYISGATGNTPLISLAQANNDANSAQTIGFVREAIANNGFGYVIVRGDLENIDTSALTEGVQLYLSPTVAGGYTTTKPSAPQHLVYVGIVVRAHPTQGKILVAVQNGYELNELHDVAIGTLANNDLLAYESSTDLWKNKTFSALGLLTTSDAASTYLSKSGGTMNNNASIAFPVGGIYTVSNNLSNKGVLIRDASNVPIARFYDTEVLIPPVGITFSDASVQTSAGISAATAASSYYPLTGNPSSFLVSADISGLAPLASPALTGNVTITTNSGGAALFIQQAGTGNILTLHDQASDTSFVAIDQNGKVNTIASTTTNAGFNVPHATAAPTSPVNGDVWTTTAALYVQIGGSSRWLVDGTTTQGITGQKTFSAADLTFGSNTGNSTVNIGTGATVSGSTRTINIGSNSVSGSTSNINIGTNGGGAGVVTIYNNVIFNGGTVTLNGQNLHLGTSTATATYNLGTGATASGSTKAVNIGTNGVAGSTTNIAIGSTTGTSTTTLQGTTNGVTEAVDTNNTELATTAFVVGQASSTTPLADGTAAVGTSLRYARADHVHANPLPTGGTTGQVLSKVDGTNYNTTWTTVSGGGSSTDYQAFTTDGTFTWTKPANAKWVEIVMFGGGGGGGAGGRYAVSTNRSGGGGAGGAAFLLARVPASTLGATETVVVGAGGTGGASASADTTAGGNGGAGGNTTFSIFTAAGGNLGSGGSTTAGTAGTNKQGWVPGSTAVTSGVGANGAVTGGSNAAPILATSAFAATGGGGGAGQSTSAISTTGGNGGGKTATTASGLPAFAGGTGGTTAGVPPTAGVAGGASGGGTGGGGGAYRTAIAGMAGAVGGFPGGGGGGGSASDNGFASGAGGAGGGGLAIIITYC
jgi:hypothetical protein